MRLEWIDGVGSGNDGYISSSLYIKSSDVVRRELARVVADCCSNDWIAYVMLGSPMYEIGTFSSKTKAKSSAMDYLENEYKCIKNSLSGDV